MKIIFTTLLMNFYVYAYNNNIGFKATYLSAVSYCPEESVKKWDCYWCNNISNFEVIDTFWDELTSTFCYFGKFTNTGTDTDTDTDIDTTNQYVLAFEGSQDLKDAKVDLNFSKLVPYKNHPYAKVHGGFWSAYKSIHDEIYDLIKNHQVDNLMVVGHSLGGALATIASLDLAEVLGINNILMVSLGAPRVGNFQYAQLYDSKVDEYYRLTHGHDPIVQLPYRLMGFHHIGHEIFYPDSSLSYIECLEGENPRCSDSIARERSNFTDHGYYMNVKLVGCGNNTNINT
jgi:hypothetical protein